MLIQLVKFSVAWYRCWIYYDASDDTKINSVIVIDHVEMGWIDLYYTYVLKCGSLKATALYWSNCYRMEGNFGDAKIWQNWQMTTKFLPSNFYTSIVKSYVNVILPPLLKNIEQIEDIFLGLHPTTCTIPSIIFLIATARRPCEFPISHSQSKFPSATQLSHINW